MNREKITNKKTNKVKLSLNINEAFMYPTKYGFFLVVEN